MKTHYADRDKTNESTMVEIWYKTLCGLEYTESPLTDDIGEVTCKHCIKKINISLNKTLDRFKKDPLYEEKKEFGLLLMKHINDLTPTEKKRYDELKIILNQL